jgi:DUF971 family protein
MNESKKSPAPVELTVHQQSRTLEIAFDDGAVFLLPFELLRVYSPSAEVRGHGQGQEVLQTGQRDVRMTAIEPVGHYAVQPSFSDGHNSGIYSWSYLYGLGAQQEKLWQDYLQRLQSAGFAGDSGRDVAQGAAPAAGCGHQH